MEEGQGKGGGSREGGEGRGGRVWCDGGGGEGGSFRPVTPPCFFGQVGREVQAIQKKIIDGKPTAGESGGRRERKKEGGREGPAWLEAAVQDERR